MNLELKKKTKNLFLKKKGNLRERKIEKTK